MSVLLPVSAFMTRPTLLDHIDLSGADSRLFVCGDVHGCFSELRSCMVEAGFDMTRDVLVSVGDLVDRGPESAEVMDWLGNPWFRPVLGNHDEMTGTAKEEHHRANGGDWFQDMDPFVRKQYSDALNASPLALEIVTPRGRRVGIVHADVPAMKWKVWTMPQVLEDPLMRASAALTSLWGRDMANAARAHFRGLGEPVHVDGIDHVFYGHTPQKAFLTSGNTTCVDTGAGKRGHVTLLEIDPWLDHLATLRDDGAGG